MEAKVVISGDAASLKLAISNAAVSLVELGATSRQAATSINGAMGQATTNVARLNTELGSSQALMGRLGGLLAGALSVGAAVALAKEMSSLNLQLERTSNTLRFASGSGEAYATNNEFLRTTVRALGLDLQSAGQQFASLSAAARGTALEGEGARSIFDAVAKASTVMGLTADQTAGSLLAIQQMISKGTVSAEELRGQLGERLPGAFQTAARAMGVTTAELGKLLEQGALTTDVFLPRFAAQMRLEMAGSVADAANAVQANLNRVKTDWAQLVQVVSNSKFTNETLKGIDQFLTALTGTLQKSKEDFKGWGDSIADTLAFVGDAANSAIGVVKAIGNAYGGAAALAGLYVKKQSDIDIAGFYADRDVRVAAIEANYKAATQAIKDGVNEQAQAVINGSSKLRDAVAKQRADLAADGPAQRRNDERRTDAQRAADLALLATKPGFGSSGKDKKDTASAYDGLSASIKQALDLANEELASSGKLSAADKFRVVQLDKLEEAYASGKIEMDAWSKLYDRVIAVSEKLEVIDERKMAQKSAEERAKAFKHEADEIKNYLVAESARLQQAARAGNDEVTAAQLQFDSFGLLKSGVEALTLARLEDQLVTKTAGTEAYESLQAQIVAKKQLIAIYQQGELRDRDVAATKRVVESIDKTAQDVWRNVLEGGTNAFEQVGKTIKREVIDVLYEMVGKKWVIGVATSAAGAFGFSGAAQASTGPGGTGSSGLGGLSNPFTNFGGFGGDVVDKIGQGLINGPFGEGLNDFGATLIENKGAIGDLIGTAGDAFGYLSAASSFANGKVGQGIGQAIGQYFGGPIGSYIGGELLKNLFGGAFVSSKSTGDSQLNSNAAGGVLSLGSAQSGRERTDYSDQAVTKLQATYLSAAKALGIASQATQFTFAGNTGAQGESPNFALGGGVFGKGGFYQSETKETPEALQLAASRAVFATLQNSELPKYLAGIFDGIVASTATKEQIDATLATAQAFKGLHDQLDALPFANLKDLSYAAASGLAAAAGGLDRLQSNLATYYDKYYNAAEKTAITTANVGKVFAELGIAMPALDQGARAAFRSIVDGLDLTREADQKAYGSLLQVAGAFDSLAPAALDLTTNANAAAKAVTDAAEAFAKMTADVLTSVRSASVDALAGLQASVDAQKSRVTAAYTAQTAVFEKSIAATGSSLAKLTALSGTLKSTLGSMSLAGSAGLVRSDAQRQLSAALATARSGGGLPKDGQLDNALRSLAQPSEALFGSFVDYQRDFFRTAADIASLTELTSGAVNADTAMQSIMQGQLDALTANHNTELARLDRLYEVASYQLDAANGINRSVQSVETALQQLTELTEAVARARAASGVAGVGGTGSTGTSSGGAGRDFYTPVTTGGVTSNVKVTDQTAIDRYNRINNYWANAADKFSPEGAAKLRADSIYYGVTQADYGVATGYGLASIQSFFARYGVPAFAAGGDFGGGTALVGEQGPELVNLGPSRVFNANQTKSILKSGTGNSDRLEKLVERLIEENSNLRQEMQAVASATAKTARILDRLSPGGNALKTTVAA